MRRTLRDGARGIVESLLLHPDSRHYRHDLLHATHSALNTLPVTENLCCESSQPPDTADSESSEPPDTADSENVQDIIEEDIEDYPDDYSSYVSLNSTLPSSLSTDAPPSLFSFSSYDSSPPRIQSPDKIDVTKLSKCKVSLNKMAFYSWSGQNEEPLKASELLKNKERITKNSSVTSGSDASQMTDFDILGVSEEAFDDNLNESFNEHYADYALDLNELKTQIDGVGVNSLMDLHLNIRRILDKTHGGPAPSQSISDQYLQLLGDAFPWFDSSSPGKFWSEWEPCSEVAGKTQSVRRQASRDYHVKPSSADHVYASRDLKRKLPTEFTMKKILNKCDKMPTLETRKCVLCGVSGDGDVENITGRLIPLRFSEWIHVNCALWSSEVYEAEDGSLQNVFAAVSRSKTLQCSASGCHTRGATLGCCHPDCSHNYHLQVGGNSHDF